MASERYKVMIGDLPPEEPKHEYTKKEIRKNFWYYNKWYFFGGALALIVVISFIVSIVTKVKPDYTIGVVTAETLPDALLTSLSNAITPFADDRNNDGKVTVSVVQYNLDFSGEFEGDPNVQMANSTRFMGDLQMCESMMFLVDDVRGMQETNYVLGYNDGTFSEEGEEIDYSNLGYRWAECTTLAQLDLGKIEIFGVDDPALYPDGQILMDSFTLALRGYDPTGKPDSDTAAYYYKAVELFNKLVGAA